LRCRAGSWFASITRTAQHILGRYRFGWTVLGHYPTDADCLEYAQRVVDKYIKERR
jgi:hypothetical protein